MFANVWNRKIGRQQRVFVSAGRKVRKEVAEDGKFFFFALFAAPSRALRPNLDTQTETPKDQVYVFAFVAIRKYAALLRDVS